MQRPVPSQWREDRSLAHESHLVLRFTGFDHRREHRRLEYVFLSPTERCGDGEVSGGGVSEGLCEAPTFMEWSTTMVAGTVMNQH